MVRRTKEAAQETRNHILDTAEQVFQAKGVAHTTLADIAKTAGVTRGAIYWHFRNKLDLFQAMMDRVKLPMEESVAAGVAAADPLAALRASALGVLNQITRDAQVQRVFEICSHKVEYTDEMSQLRERHIECRTSFLSHMEQAFAQARKKGLIRSDVKPHHAAVGLHALLDGLIRNWVLDPGYISLGRTAASIIDLYLASLLPRTAAKPARRKPAGNS